jgi:uncharacterized protein (DUF1501 family)
MPGLALTADRDDPRTLVTVFLRGGADGLSLVPPVGDDDYQRARPRIAVRPTAALRLDDRFALPPELAALLPLHREGALAIVHAAGTEDDTRSHFVAQDLIEHGGLEVAGGWLGRWLRSRQQRGDAGVAGALAAVALGDELPESLRGAPGATALRALSELDIDARSAGLHRVLAGLYAGDALLGDAAGDALAAAGRIAALQRSEYRPAPGAAYAQTADGEIAEGFSADLRRVAQLIKARVGLTAACVDLAGWDSHFVQDQIVAPRLRALATGLAAFAADLGPLLATTSVVVMSEFGRRVRENASLGTDHGRGGAMLVLGGGTPGGVHCRWPGLHDDLLEGPGDLAVVHNYRDVLAPVLARHGDADLAAVFPGHDAQPLPV